jgi:hypothetical protein
MISKEKEKEVEELNRAVERVTEAKRVFDNHPLIKKYWGLTGLAMGFIIIVLFFNNSMIGVGSVETKDSQINHLEGIGGSVETKSIKGDMSSGLGADKTNSKDGAVSTEDAYAMQGQIQTVKVYNTTLGANQIQALYHTDESSGNAKFDVADINNEVVGVFTTTLSATTSWVGLLITLMVVGVILSVTMGALFQVSRILGLR